MSDEPFIFYGEPTIWVAPPGCDEDDLGSVLEDERWELIYPKCPDVIPSEGNRDNPRL